MMHQTRDHETVNNILQNPTLWNEGMIEETLRRCKKSDSFADRDFNPIHVQELIKNYLHTLPDVMKKEALDKKIRTDVRSLSHFTLPEWVR
ncbi:MAG: hypothetical protein ACLP9S_06615 [Syntrophales bacterium]|jgi:hypothetical protein